MFSNERKVQFFGLVQPQTKPELKILEMFLVLHQNTLSVQCANSKSKKRSLLLTLLDTQLRKMMMIIISVSSGAELSQLPLSPSTLPGHNWSQHYHVDHNNHADLP